MEWTINSLIIQIVAGFVGAHLATVAAQEYRFGFAKQSAVGILAGAVSGWFFQIRAITVVTGSGSLNPVTGPELFALESLTGAIVGAIAALCVGFVLAERRVN